jgi:putative transposase
MKKKHQPSEKIQATIDAQINRHRLQDSLLESEESRPEESRPEDLLDDLSREGLRLIVQRTLEAEASEHLGRDYYQRVGNAAVHSGYRNGYERRILKRVVGRVPIQQPRLRGTRHPFRSLLLKNLARIGSRLQRLATEMYVRGLSTRDIEEALVDQDGKPMLSRSSVSHITDQLYREYEAFAKRDLSDLDVVYLFADGVYESVRKYTNGQTLLCVWAILSNGRKVMLQLAAVESESEAAWTAFFQEMVERGLRQPLLVVSDGANRS